MQPATLPHWPQPHLNHFQSQRRPRKTQDSFMYGLLPKRQQIQNLWRKQFSHQFAVKNRWATGKAPHGRDENDVRWAMKSKKNGSLTYGYRHGFNGIQTWIQCHHMQFDNNLSCTNPFRPWKNPRSQRMQDCPHAHVAGMNGTKERRASHLFAEGTKTYICEFYTIYCNVLIMAVQARKS